jgi:hypothetical protein
MDLTVRLTLRFAPVQNDVRDATKREMAVLTVLAFGVVFSAILLAGMVSLFFQ